MFSETPAEIFFVTLASLAFVALSIGLVLIVVFNQRRRLRDQQKEMHQRRKSEQEYSDLFNNVSDLVFVHSHNGEIRKINDAATRLLGYRAEDLIGHNFTEYVSEFDRERYDEYLREILSIGEAAGELSLRHKSGRPLRFQYRNVLLEGERETVNIMGVARDVTKQHEAEVMLRESEERFRGLVEVSPLPIVVFDRECIRYANPASARVFGVASNAELTGTKCSDLVGSEGAKRVEEISREVIDHGRAVELQEWGFTRNDGAVRELEIAAIPIRFSGEPAVQCVLHDITERKQAEAALHLAKNELEIRVEERTAELRALMEQAPFGVRIYQPDGKLMFVNEALATLWRMPRSELLATAPSIFSDPQFAEPETHSQLRRLFNEGGTWRSPTMFHAERPVNEDREATPGADKNGRWLINQFYAITNERGKVFRIVNIIEDETAQRAAEESAEAFRRQRMITRVRVETEERERKHISRNLHDGIGQLLTGARLSLEGYLKELEKNPPKLESALGSIEEATASIKTIIKGLYPATLDRYGLIKNAESLCREFAEQTGMNISFESYDFNERLDRSIELNLYRIIQEALTNIARHAGAKNVYVQLYHRETSVITIIEDNGVGFSYSEREFSDGSGFGLVNMKERAEMLGGSMHIESTPHEGTEIHIEIPLGPAA